MKIKYLLAPTLETAGNVPRSPISSPIKIDTGKSVEVPKEIAEMTFTKMDGTNSIPAAIQLPVEKGVNDPKSLEQAATEVKPKVEEVKTVEQPNKEIKVEEVKKEDKAKDNGLLSVIKPPKGAEDNSVTKEKIDKNSGGILPNGNKAFDYTGYTGDEQKVLKAMSNESRDFTVNLIKKAKELESKAGGIYLQHPNAYTLDPQYQQLSAQENLARKEAAFYSNQLELIKDGKEGRVLKEWDANGNPVLGDVLKPTSQIEEGLRQAITQCVQVGQNFSSQRQHYPQRYNQQINNDMQAINGERARRFEWVKNPQLLDYQVPIQTDSGIIDVPIKQVRQDIINLFPPYMRNHIAVETLGDAVVALNIQAAMLRVAQTDVQVSETKVKESKLAEPSSNSQPSPEVKGQGWGEVKEFSLVGMPR